MKAKSVDEFSQKAKEKLKVGFDFLKTKAKDTIDITKLQAQMKSLEQRRDELLLEVGQRVYVMFDMDQFAPEDVKGRIDEVREINRRLEAIQHEIQAIRKGEESSAEPDHP